MIGDLNRGFIVQDVIRRFPFADQRSASRSSRELRFVIGVTELLLTELVGKLKLVRLVCV